MKTSSPKNFILQLGSLIALYASVTSLLILIFGITNLKFPDEIAYYYEDESARQAVRNSIAMLVVFFPTYLIFTRVSNQDRRMFSQGAYSTFAKWLVYISILVGILILLVDLVVLMNFFLNGEITTRFITKVFALLIVVGITLHYYILDVRGYFQKRVDKALYFAVGAAVLVFSSLLIGYSYIETPSEVREIRLDEQQVTDLQDMYWVINEYYQANGGLPETIQQAYREGKLPEAPTKRDAYQFNIIDDTTFELCASFVASSPDRDRSYIPVTEKNYRWEHEEGQKCFVRTIETSIKLNN